MANIKKRRKNGSKSLLLVAALVASAFFVFTALNEVIETKTLTEEISIATLEKEKLQDKKQQLNKEKENLQNPEYVLRYARGKYLVTKDDGEQVFRLPDEEK